MADVFISYARDDRSLAQTLAKSLELWGYKVWWDDSLRPHQQWNTSIADALKTASAVIVIWSTRSSERDFVQAEAEKAHRAGKLVNTLDDGFSTDDIPMPFGRIHGVPVHDFKKIIDAVEDLVTRGPHPSVCKTSAAAAHPAAAEALQFSSDAIAAALDAAQALLMICNEEDWRQDETYRKRLTDAAFALEVPLVQFRDRLPYAEVTGFKDRARLAHLDRITKPVLEEVRTEANHWLGSRVTRAVLIGAQDDLRHQAEILLEQVAALA